MDGDGEDAPGDVPRLLARMEETGNRSVIFAARQRRSETFVFRIFYWLFRTMHRALTGIPVRVGNFSVIPALLVGRLVVVSELWNHYAAAVFKARLPRESVPTVRGHRLMGESRMNFVALVSHGLSALSVHAEVIGVRLLVVSVIVAAGVVGLIAAVVALRLSTSMAIPGWATNAGGLLVLFLFETVAAAVFFIFLVLHSRSQPLFIPIRDYAFFIEGSSYGLRGRSQDRRRRVPSAMTFAYQGNELDLFQYAVNWKAYYASHLRRFIRGDTLEVGAGIGGTSRFLCDGRQRSWTGPNRTAVF